MLMLDASHAIIGATIAKIVPNPYLGLPLSLISHFIGDLIPHWDLNTRHFKKTKMRIVITSLLDAGIGFIIGYTIFSSHVPAWYLLVMMWIAQLPDWIEAPYHVFDWNFPPFSSIKRLQSLVHNKLDLPWGLITQLVIVFLAVLFSYRI